jgi:hypothetical protein
VASRILDPMDEEAGWISAATWWHRVPHKPMDASSPATGRKRREASRYGDHRTGFAQTRESALQERHATITERRIFK